MNRTDFETELHAQGYREIVDRQMQPGQINSEHAHEFYARLLVLEGEMAGRFLGHFPVREADGTRDVSSRIGVAGSGVNDDDRWVLAFKINRKVPGIGMEAQLVGH